MFGMTALMSLAGCWVGGGEGDWTFDGASSLEIDLGSGDVIVGSSGDEATWVGWDGGGVGKAARPDVFQDASGAVIVDARTLLGGGDIEALVPSALPIDVLVDRGSASIELADPANVTVCVGAGDVSIGIPPGNYRLDLDLGAGSISSDIVHSDGAPYSIDVCAGAGSIDVHTYDPSRQDWDLD
jgi:hypothetical protein